MNQQKIPHPLMCRIDPGIRQKLRFGLVGIGNTLISYLAFVLLYHLFRHYIAASVLSYLIGMGVSFVLNRSFVFHSSAREGQVSGFCLVNLTTLVCSTTTLHALVQLGGLSVYPAQILAVGVSMVINFLGYRAIFRDGVSVNHILSRLFENQSVVNRMVANQLFQNSSLKNSSFKNSSFKNRALVTQDVTVTQGVEKRDLGNDALSKTKPTTPSKQTGNQYPDRAEIAKWLILIGLVIVTMLNIHESMLENIAHDALPYMDQYVDKFTSEGRWINFALFEFLRGVPVVVAVCLCNAFVFLFGYQVCRGMKQEPWLALCFGLVMVNIPYFTMLFKWPMTLLPGTLMLAVFARLRDRYSRTTLLLIAGVVLFATYPAFYFLMPLLFIRPLSEESYPGLVRFLVIWIIGYGVGYAVAQGSVYCYTSLWTDHPQFIQFASWRKSTPTTDLTSLLSNIAKSSGNFERNALYLAKLSPLFYLPVAVVAVWALKQQTRYMITVLLMIFSLYASVVLLGVKVPLRSGVTLPIGLMMIALLMQHPWERFILLLTLCIPFAYMTHHYNHGYNEKRIMIATMLEANDPHGYLKQSKHFKQVIVSLDEAKTSRYFYDRTHSEAFKNITYLRSHYIEPYLYKFGWRQADIKVENTKQDHVDGDAWVTVDGETVHLNLD